VLEGGFLAPWRLQGWSRRRRFDTMALQKCIKVGIGDEDLASMPAAAEAIASELAIFDPLVDQCGGHAALLGDLFDGEHGRMISRPCKNAKLTIV